MTEQQKKGLVLDRVVLLGRTFEEYRRYFLIDPQEWRGKQVLDVASGVSSFCCESNELGLITTACDPIYELSPEIIKPRCVADLDHVVNSINGLQVYRWKFYQNPVKLRHFRETSYRLFLEDYERKAHLRYRPGALPNLPFLDATFDLSLVSYLLFAYQDKLTYTFHREAISELMRVTRGEARIYPLVTFEGERSIYVEQLTSDPQLKHFSFEIVPTEFEFLIGSNCYLRVKHR